MKKMIVLALPGIGTKQMGFSKSLDKDIKKHAANTEMINNYQMRELLPFRDSFIDQNQQQLFERVDSKNDLGGIFSPRKFVMEAFGDALTFEREPALPNSPYKIIHRYLRAEIKRVNEVLDEYPGSRLVIVAGSLGVHVLSTYIWDADHNIGIFQDSPSDRTDNLRNLDYLASIGCNIPLFISGLEETRIIAFDKRGLDFEWDNFFDKNDVLGWPLKQLSPSYEALVNDYQINTGLFVGSHIRYWDDDNFTRPFAQKLVELYNS